MWRQTLQRVGRVIQEAITMDHSLPKETSMFRFKSEHDVRRWEAFSDAIYGGLSTANLSFNEASESLTFQGHYTTELPPDGAGKLLRSGFCGMRSVITPNEHLPLEYLDAIAFKAKGDGRQYILNLKTEDWVGHSLPGIRANDDVWQAFFFSEKDRWTEVEVPFSRFMLTHRGRVVRQEVELDTRRVMSLGLSLAGGEYFQDNGPYRLEIKDIVGRRLPRPASERASRREAEGG